MIGPDNIVIGNPDLLWSEIDGEVVMLDVESGAYFNFDRTGSDIWRQLDRPVTVAALCDALASRYEAPLETIRSDVLRFLERMAGKGIVRVET